MKSATSKREKLIKSSDNQKKVDSIEELVEQELKLTPKQSSKYLSEYKRWVQSSGENMESDENIYKSALSFGIWVVCDSEERRRLKKMLNYTSAKYSEKLIEQFDVWHKSML